MLRDRVLEFADSRALVEIGEEIVRSERRRRDDHPRRVAELSGRGYERVEDALRDLRTFGLRDEVRRLVHDEGRDRPAAPAASRAGERRDGGAVREQDLVFTDRLDEFREERRALDDRERRAHEETCLSNVSRDGDRVAPLALPEQRVEFGPAGPEREREELRIVARREEAHPLTHAVTSIRPCEGRRDSSTAS